MPRKPIPFIPNQESGSDVLGGASPFAMNVVMDGRGTVRRRPGIKDFEVEGDAIAGLGDGSINTIYVDNDGIIYVAQNTSGDIHNIYTYDTTQLRSAGVTFGLSGDMRVDGKVVFAETEAIVVLAGGKAPKKIPLSIPRTLSNLGGSPPEMSHVVANASRLVSNDAAAPNRIRFSGLAAGSSTTGHETWDATGFVSADARPDPIVAIQENTDEVFAFGRTNLQVFSPDPSSVYAPAATREIGCASAHSIIKFEQKFAWIDNQRRAVVSDGREFQFLNTPAIKSTLDAMETVSDCYGYRVLLGPIDCMVWTFPTANVTLCYQIGGGWSQWGSWNPETNNWKQFVATSFARNPVTHEQYVGTADGEVGVLSFDVHTDRSSPEGSDPTTIPAYVETGAVDHGTNLRKWCKGVTLSLQRGGATNSQVPNGHIQYRDDNGPWSDKIPLNLGAPGDTQPVVQVQTGGLGYYRFRQWRIWFDGEEPFVLVRAEEDFEVLEV